MEKKLYTVTLEPNCLYIITDGGYSKALDIALKHFPKAPEAREEIITELMAEGDGLIIE